MHITTATLTCPLCQFAQTVTMPTDACQFFYRCPHCQAVVRPKAGDCCVFCSYADVPCPPMQAIVDGQGRKEHGRQTGSLCGV